jgi:hypothetical protein
LGTLAGTVILVTAKSSTGTSESPLSETVFVGVAASLDANSSEAALSPLGATGVKRTPTSWVSPGARLKDVAP